MDGHAVAALFRAYGIFLWILQDTLRTKQFHRIDTIWSSRLFLMTNINFIELTLPLYWFYFLASSRILSCSLPSLDDALAVLESGKPWPTRGPADLSKVLFFKSGPADLGKVILFIFVCAMFLYLTHRWPSRSEQGHNNHRWTSRSEQEHGIISVAFDDR